MKKSTVFIVEDHRLVREMFVQLFRQHPRFELVGANGVFNEAIEQVKIIRPDIVLLDIDLEGGSGLDAVPIIRKFSPGTKIIMVTMYGLPAYVSTILRAGAKGYVTKTSPGEEFYKALEVVSRGGIYLCNEIEESIVEQKSNFDRESSKSLSMREVEVIKYLKMGYSSKEIAVVLNIAVKTVEVHRYNILKKLDQKNTSALINYIQKSHEMSSLFNC